MNNLEPGSESNRRTEFTPLWAVCVVMAAAGVYYVIGLAWRAIENSSSSIWEWSLETILLVGAAVALSIRFMIFMKSLRRHAKDD